MFGPGGSYFQITTNDCKSVVDLYDVEVYFADVEFKAADEWPSDWQG